MRTIQMVLFAVIGWLSWSCNGSPAGADAGTSTVDAGAGGSTADAGGGGQSSCSSREDFSEACQLERNRKCFQQPLSACSKVEYCGLITGAKINADQACVEMPMASIACGVMIFGCTGAMSLGIAPDGTRWMLSGGCLPYGWSGGDPMSGLPDCGAGGSGGGGGAGP